MGILVPGDNSGKAGINDFNLWMRQQPWYQQWFQQRGLNPNQVQLSKGQRQELERAVIQNGAPPNAFNDMMIDPAGNLNNEHGFASLPTWAKVAIGAGAVAGGGLAVGALGGAAEAVGTAGAGGAGTAGAGAGTGATLAGTAGTAATASSPSWFTGSTLASLAGQGAGLVAGIYANKSQLSASERASQAQQEAARAAAELEAKAAADQLAFLREQEARRQMEWDKTQTMNREQYERALAMEQERYAATQAWDREKLAQAEALEQQKLGINQQRYDELQQRLAPYREMGQNAFNNIGNSGVAPGGYVVPRATFG